MRAYDVAVIGAGVFGSWTAYWLARRGHSVLLVDAYGAASNRASSGGESRIIRMSYGADEVYTRFSWRSLGLWKSFFEETKLPLFHRTGALAFADAEHPSVRESAAVLARCGIPFEDLAGDEIGRRWPQFQFEAPVRGLFEPESGALMARRAVQAVAAAAVNMGAQLAVESVLPTDGKGVLSELTLAWGGAIPAGRYVFACGPWLPKMFPASLGSRIFPTRQEVFFFGVPAGSREFSPGALPVWLDRLDTAIPYGFPDLEGRGLKAAFDVHGPRFDPDSGERIASAEGLAGMRAYVAERFPRLAGAPVTEARVCQYENTSNGDLIVDRHPGFDNVWIVGGGSGHGFKHGPAVGEYLADRMDGKGEAEPRFSLAGKETVQHRQVF